MKSVPENIVAFLKIRHQFKLGHNETKSYRDTFFTLTAQFRNLPIRYKIRLYNKDMLIKSLNIDAHPI